MAEKIIRGYLIEKKDFKVFDEIITFISSSGRKYTCMSMGSRKIESKNSRNLFLGSLIEFEIFEARSVDKVSKLKKAHVVVENDWNMGVINSFNLLNELMLKSPITTQEFFTFYRTILELIKNETNFDEKIKILIILEKYCVLCGIPMEVKCCVVCKSIVVHTISFANHGLLCKNCTNSEHVQPQGSYVTKVFYFLFNEEYDKMGRYYQELDYCIKLLKKYIKDELDMVLYSLKGF